MWRVLVLVFALLGWIGYAHANVTKTNFNGLGSPTFDPGNRVVERDIYGNALDAHSGNFVDYNGLHYLIGEQQSCGFRPGVASTSCGVSVYSTPDYADGNYTPLGLLIDANVAPWSTPCASSGALAFPGCYRPHIFPQAGTGKFVVWIQTPSTTAGATIALCDTPVGPCTKQADPTHIAHTQVGDFSICTTCGANNYLIYRFAGDNSIRIDQLTSDGLDSTGTSVDTGMFGEAPLMFGDAATGGTSTYALAGAICAYCDGGALLSYRKASTPLGTYGATTTLNADGCKTQPSSLEVITAGGSTNYVYRGDNWVNLPNEGLAMYYWHPLTVSAGAITPFTCTVTATLLGVTAVPGSSPWPAVDQSNYPSTNGFWQGTDSNACIVSNSKWCMQTFVPTKASLASVGMALGQNNRLCAVPDPSCAGPDGSLVAALYTIDGSNNPLTLLSTITIPVANLKWAPQFTLLGFNQTVTPGNKYGVVLKPSGLTVSGGFYSVSYDNASDNTTAGSYPTGKFRKSTDSGVTWADNGTNPQAALFSTFPQVGVPFSGVAH